MRILLFMAILLTTACSNIKPWVKPYDRDVLSTRVMMFERDPISTRYMNHVYESRESARGAEGSAGGGCGCN